MPGRPLLTCSEESELRSEERCSRPVESARDGCCTMDTEEGSCAPWPSWCRLSEPEALSTLFAFVCVASCPICCERCRKARPQN